MKRYRVHNNLIWEEGAAQAITCRDEDTQSLVAQANAAIDLRAACEAAIEAMGAHGPCENNSCSECKATWKKLHAALAVCKERVE